jgi:hypothetical protein
MNVRILPGARPVVSTCCCLGFRPKPLQHLHPLSRGLELQTAAEAGLCQKILLPLNFLPDAISCVCASVSVCVM